MTASVLNYRSHKSVKKQMKHYLNTHTVFLYKSNFTTNGKFVYLDILTMFQILIPLPKIIFIAYSLLKSDRNDLKTIKGLK